MPILRESLNSNEPVYCSIFSKDVIVTFRPEVLSVFTDFILNQPDFQTLNLEWIEVLEKFPWLFFLPALIGYHNPELLPYKDYKA
ncbi:MAG: hypothetical protein ACOC4M_16400 [Promethearchaeia archaeon]